MHRYWRIIRVAKCQLTAERFCRGVERRLEIVVGALFPVAGTGRPGAAAIEIARRKIQRREQRGIGDAGAIEARPWRSGTNITGGRLGERRRRGGKKQQAARDASSCTM